MSSDRWLGLARASKAEMTAPAAAPTTPATTRTRRAVVGSAMVPAVGGEPTGMRAATVVVWPVAAGGLVEATITIVVVVMVVKVVATPTTN
ncbi:hypothetical protein VMCG_04937 [Cytospora schulzeri]|uniref:Uncharacterized protein n=1 Tax=Cytospora schulzeri TaxID=448051 RepID=A0A423WMH0_9PEZI|nr:hypothetical protein VMCG_04937 [Valsa malicola]